jgi:putative membrane protein
VQRILGVFRSKEESIAEVIMARFFLPFAIVFGFATAAFAADPASNQAASTPAPAATTFVTSAAAGNLFEIESSKLALTRTKSGEVKAFATRMVDDHTVAGTKFKQALKDAKIAPPAEQLDTKHQALLDALKAKDAASFDKAYIEVQYNAHVETVDLFKSYARSGDNARLKIFTNEVLPTLQGHLDHVAKLR